MAIQFNSNNQIVNINLPNPNLDGTGPISSIVTGAPTFGSILSTVRIQSTGNTVIDVVRFFIKPSGGLWSLIKEIPVMAIDNSLQTLAFGQTVNFNLLLEAGYEIGVSTDQGTLYVVSSYTYDITGFI